LLFIWWPSTFLAIANRGKTLGFGFNFPNLPGEVGGWDLVFTMWADAIHSKPIA
jgi:hypothetical protein